MDVPDEALRPGLELAFVVAVLGTRQRPPIPAPPSLRPFLRFQKLPPAALVPVRRAVEDDDAFRARVAAVAGDATVDRPSWLWLHRPEGWQDALVALMAEHEPDGGADASGPMARRLEAAEAKVRRLSSELAVLRDEVDRAQDGRARAEAEEAKARARQAELERAAERARQRAEQVAATLAAAERDRDEARVAAEAAREEAEALRRRVVELEAAAATAGSAAAVPVAAEGAVGADVADAPAPSPRERAAPDLVSSASVPSPAAGAPWPRRAQEALDGAAGAAASLAASLRDLAASMAADPASGAPVTSPLAATPPPVPRPPARPADTPSPRPARRRALRVPRGMHAGTPEADAWLLTQAEAAVVVDGYNVAKLGWPDAVLADQRERLLDVLEDLTARYGTTVEVVFDGADVGPIRPGRRRRVAVRFSPATVSADDVIRELVAGFPPTDPIVVVTNDRAVAHDVRAAGANVVSSDGLLAVARR